MVELTRESIAALAEAKKHFPPVYVVYQKPLDFPSSIVVRVWYGLTPSPICHVFHTVDMARIYANENGACLCLLRSENDDPCIVECWI